MFLKVLDLKVLQMWVVYEGDGYGAQEAMSRWRSGQNKEDNIWTELIRALWMIRKFELSWWQESRPRLLLGFIAVGFKDLFAFLFDNDVCGVSDPLMSRVVDYPLRYSKSILLHS